MLQLELLGVSHAEQHQFPVVWLRHENRVLPIWVGIFEADAIQRRLLGEKPPRPMTHDLICNLLAGLRAELKSVTIYQLENDTFYAHLNVEQKNAQGHVEQVLRIDTRPSAGIAIAVRLGCPIFAAEEVMDRASEHASIFAQAEDSATDEGESEGEGEGPDEQFRE